MKKHRKIFYFPGMISLLVLPLICLFNFYINQAFTDYRCIDIHLGGGCFNNDTELIFYKKQRNFKTIYLTEDQELNEFKINEIRIKTKDLFIKNDSVNGIKINFEKSNYQNFITVLENIFIDDVNTYVLENNEIIVFNIPPKKSTNQSKPFRIINCGYYEANKDYWEKLEQERKHEENIKLFKQNWVIFLAYFGIVLLNIIALIKWRKIRLIS